LLVHRGVLFWPAGPTDRYPQDARGLLVIASGSDVRIGQHDIETSGGKAKSEKTPAKKAEPAAKTKRKAARG
jgi:hypothetical protein